MRWFGLNQFHLPDWDEFTSTPEETIHSNTSNTLFHSFEIGFIIPWFDIEDNVRLGDNFALLGFLCFFTGIVFSNTLSLNKNHSNITKIFFSDWKGQVGDIDLDFFGFFIDFIIRCEEIYVIIVFFCSSWGSRGGSGWEWSEFRFVGSNVIPPSQHILVCWIISVRNLWTEIMDLLSGDDLIALKSSTSTWDGTQPPAYELSKRKAFNFSRPAALDTSPKDISQTTLNYKILVFRILMVISRIFFLWILFSQWFQWWWRAQSDTWGRG